MNLRTPARLLLFDVDETLLQSEEIRMQIRNEYLQKNWHVEPMNEQEYRLHCVGKSLRLSIVPWLKKTRPGIKASVMEIAFTLKERENKMYKKGAIKTTPFACDFLEAAQNSGLILGVCTGESQQDIANKLKCVNFDQYFDLHNRVSRSEAGGQFKPSPAMYLVNWAQYAATISRQAVRVFEDNEEGILSGYYGGFPTIAVPSSWSLGQDFSRATGVATNGFQTLLEHPKKYLGRDL